MNEFFENPFYVGLAYMKSQMTTNTTSQVTGNSGQKGKPQELHAAFDKDFVLHIA